MAHGSQGRTNAPIRGTKLRLEPGKSVSFVVGRRRVPATILENRGPLARDGMHIVRIAIFPDDPEQRDEFEVQEDTLESA